MFINGESSNCVDSAVCNSDSSNSSVEMISGSDFRVRQLEMFFSYDHEVAGMSYQLPEGGYGFEICMEDYFKALALRMVIPSHYDDLDLPLTTHVFSIVDGHKVEITGVPTDKSQFVTYNMIRTAFDSNELVQDIRCKIDVDFHTQLTQVIFKHDAVVQFPAEDRSDYQGVETELPEDMARELFTHVLASFSTAV